MCRESGWLFSPATRTGRGQTHFMNISTGKTTPFIGFGQPAAPTRVSPPTLGKAAGSKSLSASSSTRGLTTERSGAAGNGYPVRDGGDPNFDKTNGDSSGKEWR